ncbi:MAG: hypothetical protein EXQ56_10720 [Acidobacteria bacterium]|nr:hypothetical protein [Acidobacteriota bacterium]
MPTPRGGVTIAPLGGKIYVFGGVRYDADANELVSLAVVESYNPSTNTTSAETAMPSPRESLVAGAVGDNIFVVGGVRRTGPYTGELLAVNEVFHGPMQVSIDIKPGDPRNRINLRSNATITVAILSSATFGASTVNPATVTLAGAPLAVNSRGTLLHSFSDVNDDGRLDLLVVFRSRDLQLSSDDTEAVLEGATFTGQRIQGVDMVQLGP